MSRIAAATLSVVLLAPSLPCAGQTLADVARREEDRRKTVKPSGRTITNRDLQVVAPAAAPASDQSAGVGGGQGAATPPSAAHGDKKATDGGSDQGRAPAMDQKAWRERLAQLQTQLDRDRTFAEALQTRINSLTTDFVNRDDPAQRATIAVDRQKSIDELNRLKKAIVDGTKAVTDFEEEARRAGVPPGWLR